MLLRARCAFSALSQSRTPDPRSPRPVAPPDHAHAYTAAAANSPDCFIHNKRSHGRSGRRRAAARAQHARQPVRRLALGLPSRAWCLMQHGARAQHGPTAERGEGGGRRRVLGPGGLRRGARFCVCGCRLRAAALTPLLRAPPQEERDDAYASEAEEVDQFDSDFNESEACAVCANSESVAARPQTGLRHARCPDAGASAAAEWPPRRVQRAG
jgi:hypothetical protein